MIFWLEVVVEPMTPHDMAKLGLQPVNRAAARGLRTAGTSLRPKSKVDCRGWSDARLQSYFERRFPEATAKLIRELVDGARNDGWFI
jgi:hypothetical protein